MNEFLAGLPFESMAIGMFVFALIGAAISIYTAVRYFLRSRREVTVKIVVTEGELTIPLDPKWSKAERDKAISKAVDEYLQRRRAEKLPARG
jgi:hypothetical protein